MEFISETDTGQSYPEVPPVLDGVDVPLGGDDPLVPNGDVPADGVESPVLDGCDVPVLDVPIDGADVPVVDGPVEIGEPLVVDGPVEIGEPLVVDGPTTLSEEPSATSLTDLIRDTEEVGGPDWVDPSPNSDTLPDGTAVVVTGDKTGADDYVEKQGNNDYGIAGDCGLCSAGAILDQFGIEVTEAEIVDHAVTDGDCQIVEGDPAKSGATTVYDQASVLGDYGVAAHPEMGCTPDELAQHLEQGRGAIIEVNAGILWQDPNAVGEDPGQFNHAVVATGVAYNAETHEIEGFYIGDSGTGESKFIDLETINSAWQNTGGHCVVTDNAPAEEGNQ